MLKEIAHPHVAVMVEAARHHRSVGKHTNLVAQGVAEYFLCVFGVVLKVGPFKHVVVLDIQVFGKLPTVIPLRPRLRMMPGNKLQNRLVHAVASALVLKAQHDDTSATGRFTGKCHHFINILLEIFLAVTLMRVQ